MVEPDTINPVLNTDKSVGYIMNLVYDGLFTIDKNYNIVPQLVSEYSTSSDGKSIKIKLKDAKWHNGDPVTAQDFEFAWDQLFKLSNGGNYASTWAPLIKGASEVLACKDDASYEAALANKGWKASISRLS